MLLERVEIVGFRGINRLSLMLEQNNVLIGENAWGKSSLLDALTLLLSPEFDLYHFVRDDFWFPRATSGARTPFAYNPDLPRNGAKAAIGSGVSVRFSAAGCLAMTGITGCSIARRASSPKMTA